jgi:hypothetical protein
VVEKWEEKGARVGETQRLCVIAASLGVRRGRPPGWLSARVESRTSTPTPARIDDVRLPSGLQGETSSPVCDPFYPAA